VSRSVLLLSSTFASRVGLAVSLAVACFAGTAAATPEDTFPQTPTRAEILRWLTGNSDLSPEAVVTMTDEVVVAIAARQDGRGVGRSTRLTLREEVINPDAAAAWGGRSIQLDLDLDCSRHRVILGARRIYARPNLQGSARITRSDNAWSEVPPDTVIDDVARSACAPQQPAQLAAAQPAPARPPATEPPPAVGAQPPVRLAAADPAPPPEPSAPAEAPPAAPIRLAAANPQSGKVVTSEPPAAPAPLRPSPAPAEAPPPSEAPVQVAAADPASGKMVAFDPPSTPVAPPAPAATAVTIAAPSGTSVAVVGAAPASPAATQVVLADQTVVVHNPFAAAAAQESAKGPARPAARPAPAAAPAGRPPEFAVQIAAAASADLARDSWQSLKAKLPSLVGPRTFAVEPVETKGRTLYRALLLGFASPDEAASVCKELRSQSVDCILRQLR